MTRIKTFILLAYISIASLSSAMITPALPKIEHLYHISHSSLEWVVSIFLIGYVAGQLIYGPIANRLGRLNALRIGLFINLIGIVICIFGSIISHNYDLLLLGRLVTALGAASGLVCTFILIQELFPPSQAKHTMGYAILSFTFGIGISVTLGSLLTEYANWTDCFWILLAYGVLMLCCTRLFTETIKEKISIHPRIILKAYTNAFRNKSLVIFSLLVGIVSVYAYGYSATVPIYSEITLKLSPSHYGYWSLLNTLGMTISGFLSVYLIKKYGVKNTLLTGIASLVPFLLLLIFLCVFHHKDTLLFFIANMFLFIVTGLLFPTASYYALHAIEDRANASGVMSFINMSLGALSVIVIGYLPFAPMTSFLLVLSVLFVAVSAFALKQMRL
jgi:DHA1 family bicyclomycin/chloramphenicol resistance-like MFS transporter